MCTAPKLKEKVQQIQAFLELAGLTKPKPQSEIMGNNGCQLYFFNQVFYARSHKKEAFDPSIESFSAQNEQILNKNHCYHKCCKRETLSEKVFIVWVNIILNVLLSGSQCSCLFLTLQLHIRVHKHLGLTPSYNAGYVEITLIFGQIKVQLAVLIEYSLW